MRIRKRKIVNFGSPYIIAEIGSNHNGDMALAKKMIDAAARCGVDCVKFQSFDNKSLISESEYQRNQTYDDGDGGKKHFGSLRDMVDKYYLRREQHFELREYCLEKGVEFCSTPFSKEEVDLLVECDVPFFKVASMDINNIELLAYMAQKKRPIIISTGMADLNEIAKAIDVVKENGAIDISLLHCISIYPPESKDINLRNITMLQNTFNLPVGFSDHSIGTTIPLASVALGACVIEKHFTIDKNLPGWDHAISADVQELETIVTQTKAVNEGLGSYTRVVSEAELNKRDKFRRSLVYSRNLQVGHRISESDLESKRPGTGIKPVDRDIVLGRVLTKNVECDKIVNITDFQ